MPRRPPAAVRAARPIRRDDFGPAIPRLSSRTMDAIRRLERERFHSDAIYHAVHEWRYSARTPSYSRCECCDRGFGRGILEIALHALPKRAARELRGLITPADDEYLARNLPDPKMPADLPWWHRHSW